MNTAKIAVSLAGIFHLCLCHKFYIFLKPYALYGKGVKWKEIKYKVIEKDGRDLKPL
jgi:hypothetical protein